ncbi:hypothetical protein Tco_0875022 [Tanacetum coccineum]|uniref:MAK10-like protein n=1 Tax=Tanacetum coccineum TaxID=301880 RepID=A0ABQ5BNN1_9ASTR
MRRTIDQLAGGKLHDRNAKESWALLDDLSLYKNESWNNPRDFTNPVKAISLPQDVPSTSDRRLIELENQVQCGPHDTQYCMENPEQAFLEYASSCTDEVGEGLVSNFMASQDARLSRSKAGALPSDEVKNQKLNIKTTTSVLSVRSYLTIDPNAHLTPTLQSIPSKHVPRRQAIHIQVYCKSRWGLEQNKLKNPDLFLKMNSKSYILTYQFLKS